MDDLRRDLNTLGYTFADVSDFEKDWHRLDLYCAENPLCVLSARGYEPTLRVVRKLRKISTVIVLNTDPQSISMVYRYEGARKVDLGDNLASRILAEAEWCHQAELVQEELERLALRHRDRSGRTYKKRDELKQLSARAVRSTLVNPGRCDQCGSDRHVAAHHTSYEHGQWLNVQWLCKVCHEEADRIRELQTSKPAA
jgi:hypothetical protein